ncbi:DNA mismatch repair protein MutL [Emericellopsis cladophorae]|uniref:DNA mismatch repair protein MutL n=1 Tax=Emericellopsis cladophorae TaxID=2686198 RepID=A0A9P9YAE4_9HYPO|nr:DNA mismatch repair protein MutL [Emericellopsis cladophorae]KAI6785993.1 DNA mismatch repair protein MutL [Emericellopsis cladophorae]
MTIAKLNFDTVRLLGSSVTISDPPSLVKELLDNAIDAGATTIEVLISPNTADRIHVRDNGAGIPAEDLASLGKRAHTSKLRCFEDLVGTRTLGFRGEALASANAVSKGGLKITTKTSADSVATKVTLNSRGGGVAEQKPVPAPQGTTVLVEGLFDNIAVRKQQAIRESRKALARTRDLLLSYALARPHVKMNLKVPGEPKQQWSYSPGPKPTAKHAVMQLLSKEASAQCAVVQKNEAELLRLLDIEPAASLTETPQSRGSLIKALIKDEDATANASDAAESIEADMRVDPKVNMARNISDATDEECLVDVQSVRVPAIPVQGNACKMSTEKAKKQSRIAGQTEAFCTAGRSTASTQQNNDRGRSHSRCYKKPRRCKKLRGQLFPSNTMDTSPPTGAPESTRDIRIHEPGTFSL